MRDFSVSLPMEHNHSIDSPGPRERRSSHLSLCLSMSDRVRSICVLSVGGVGLSSPQNDGDRRPPKAAQHPMEPAAMIPAPEP